MTPTKELLPRLWKTKQVWIVWTNSDLTEGRGYLFPLRICETKATAIRLASKAGVMGSDANVLPFNAIEYEGHWLAPFSMTYATRDDKDRQKELDSKDEAIQRAKELGLTDTEIDAIRL